MSARKRAHRVVKAEPIDFKPKPEPGQDAIDLTGYETPPTASPRKKARKSPRKPRDDDSDYEPADDAAEAAATPSRTGRSPRTPATPKVQLPPATDPSTWRKSMLGPNKTVRSKCPHWARAEERDIDHQDEGREALPAKGRRFHGLALQPDQVSCRILRLRVRS
jgi:hypothetical protein